MNRGVRGQSFEPFYLSSFLFLKTSVKKKGDETSRASKELKVNPYMHCVIFVGHRQTALSNRKFRTSQISHSENWYQLLTAHEKLAPIRHVLHTNISHFVKNAHVVKLYVAKMRFLTLIKCPRNLLHFAFDSNSSHT